MQVINSILNARSNDAFTSIDRSILMILTSLSFALVIFLFGLSSYIYIALPLFLVSVVFLNAIFYQEIRGSHGSFLAAGLMLSLYGVYIYTRLEFLDFSLSVGDSSSYLWAGVDCAINNNDSGFFLPLTASLNCIFYPVGGITMLPLGNVILTSLCIPILYFLLREFDIDNRVKVIILFLYCLSPLSIWFSKTNFSEPAWQFLILVLTYYTIKTVSKLEFINLLLLLMTMSLMMFSRGDSILIFPFLGFLFLVFSLNYGASFKLISFCTLSYIILMGVFYFLMNIRTEYMIGWQLSKFYEGVEIYHVFLLLLSILLLSIVFASLLSKKRHAFWAEYSKYIVAFILVCELIVAGYLSNSRETSFLDILAKPYVFLIYNFGYVFSIISILGLGNVIVKSYLGQVKYLLLLSIYILFTLPFLTMGIFPEKSHELFLYWHRYYFSTAFIFHVIFFVIMLSNIYGYIERLLIINVKLYPLKTSFFVFLSICIALLPINSANFDTVVRNGYLNSTGEFFEWIEKTVSKEDKLVIVYDDASIKYGPYDFELLITRGLRVVLGRDSLIFKKLTEDEVSSYLESISHRYESFNVMSVLNDNLKLDGCSLRDNFYSKVEWIWQEKDKYKVREKQIKASILYCDNNILNSLGVKKAGFWNDGWSGKYSSVKNLRVDTKNKSIIKVTLNKISPKNPSFDVYLNGYKEALDLVGQSEKDFYYQIPNTVSTIKSIKFELLKTFNPKLMGRSNDDRDLGVNIKSITLLQDIP